MSVCVAELTPDQLLTLQCLKETLQSCLPQAPCSFYDDRYFLRFLRARNFDLVTATEMCRRNLQWRRDEKIDEILHDPTLPDPVIARLIPYGFYGFARNGSPVVIERSGAAQHAECLKLKTLEQIVRTHVYLQEKVLRICRERGRDKMIVIMDMQGLHLSRVTKKCVRCVPSNRRDRSGALPRDA